MNCPENGTYSMAYSGDIGVGIGVFTVVDGALAGADAGGGKYCGHALQDPETGEIAINFSLFVPAGLTLVQGTSPLEFDSTKTGLFVRLPPEYGNGQPVTLDVPPGRITVMIRRVPDEYKAFLTGFRLVPAA